MTDKIIAHAAEGIGWLTLNNPAKRNAISLEMWQGIADTLTRFEADPEVKVVVMRGAGGKSFAAGADISQFEDQRKSAEQAKLYDAAQSAGRVKLETFAKPLVAMIEGFCMGGGLVVATQADIRIAAEGSVFGVPAGRLGLAYNYPSVTKVMNIVGVPATYELLLTARRFDTDWALRTGLVNMVVPAGSLEEEVRKVASEIAGNAPLTLKLVKHAVRQALRDPADRDWAGLEAMAKACFDSEDYKEGRRAFMEKRKPVFTGR